MGAKSVAHYLLYIMLDAYSDITNVKLNELVYFAQGHCLRQYGHPLFTEHVEAWRDGPMVPAVCDAYRQYADEPIMMCDGSLVKTVPPEAEKLLFDIARTYGKYTTSVLQSMSRAVGSPWSRVYTEDENAVIPQSMIHEYFIGAELLREPDIDFTEADFIGYRDENGILVLPKEWDDEE